MDKCFAAQAAEGGKGMVKAMKVGIVTFHASCNYGAALQCLCLQRALESLGCEAEVIDFTAKPLQPLPVWKGWGLSRSEPIQNVLSRAIGLIHGPRMMQKFAEFRRSHFNLSEPCPDSAALEKTASKYDVIIAGSDQLWNQGHSPVYFLEWGRSYEGKRLSYAACFGQREQPPHVRENAGAWLRRFSSISVRNTFSQELVRELSDRNSIVVADPTLLMDLSALCCAPKIRYKDYILTYTLHQQGHKTHGKMVHRLKKELGGLPVVTVVLSATCPHPAPWADQVLWSASPEEWLHLMANARFVYTDSFHGAIYAMKYQRPFMVLSPKGWRAPRLEDLVHRYGIQDRRVADYDEASANKPWEKPLNYHDVNSRMESHTQESLNWLKCSLFEQDKQLTPS